MVCFHCPAQWHQSVTRSYSTKALRHVALNYHSLHHHHDYHCSILLNYYCHQFHQQFWHANTLFDRVLFSSFITNTHVIVFGKNLCSSTENGINSNKYFDVQSNINILMSSIKKLYLQSLSPLLSHS